MSHGLPAGSPIRLRSRNCVSRPFSRHVRLFVHAICTSRDTVQELWAAMKSIKDLIRGMIGDGNTGVRTAVLKFLELQILAQSLKTTDSETKRSADAGLEIVPLRHPILDVSNRSGQPVDSTSPTSPPPSPHCTAPHIFVFLRPPVHTPSLCSWSFCRRLPSR